MVPLPALTSRMRQQSRFIRPCWHGKNEFSRRGKPHRLMFVCGEAAGLVADQRTIANVAAAAANGVAVLVLEATPTRPMAFDAGHGSSHHRSANSSVDRSSRGQQPHPARRGRTPAAIPSATPPPRASACGAVANVMPAAIVSAISGFANFLIIDFSPSLRPPFERLHIDLPEVVRD